MISKKETEMLFVYCLEELRLLIEKPYERDLLTKRLSTIKNNLEVLYQQTLLKRSRNKTMQLKIEDNHFYSVLELSQKLNVTTVTIRNYLKQGRLKGQKTMGRWFISGEELIDLFKDSN